VTITQRNKPRLVLLSIEDYRKLTSLADTRKAGRLEAMIPEMEKRRAGLDAMLRLWIILDEYDQPVGRIGADRSAHRAARSA
jgi:hypothetical protein